MSKAMAPLAVLDIDFRDRLDLTSGFSDSDNSAGVACGPIQLPICSPIPFMERVVLRELQRGAAGKRCSKEGPGPRKNLIALDVRNGCAIRGEHRSTTKARGFGNFENIRFDFVQTAN